MNKSIPMDVINDAIDFLDTCQKHEAVEALDALVDDRHALRAALTAAGDALRELLESEATPIPHYEAGKEAQDAWADRRAAARNNARAILAKGETK